MSMRTTKTFKAHVEVNKAKREVTAIISTDSVDSDADVVLPAGLVKKQFAGMKVLWRSPTKRSCHRIGSMGEARSEPSDCQI